MSNEENTINIEDYCSFYHRFAMLEADGQNVLSANTEADLRDDIGHEHFDKTKAAGGLFWSVYGVDEGGLSDCIEDLTTEEAAIELRNRLNKELASKGLFREPAAEKEIDIPAIVEHAVAKGEISQQDKVPLTRYYDTFKQIAEKKYAYGDFADEEFETVLRGFKQLSVETKAATAETIKSAVAEVDRIAEKFGFERRSGYGM